jgi:hypothetical protein
MLGSVSLLAYKFLVPELWSVCCPCLILCACLCYLITNCMSYVCMFTSIHVYLQSFSKRYQNSFITLMNDSRISDSEGHRSVFYKYNMKVLDLLEVVVHRGVTSVAAHSCQHYCPFSCMNTRFSAVIEPKHHHHPHACVFCHRAHHS